MIDDEQLEEVNRMIADILAEEKQDYDEEVLANWLANPRNFGPDYGE